MESLTEIGSHSCLVEDLAENLVESQLLSRGFSRNLVESQLIFSREFGEGFSEDFGGVATQIALNLTTNLAESQPKDC